MGGAISLAYSAGIATSIGSTIDGSSFSGLLTRIEIGHIRMGGTVSHTNLSGKSRPMRSRETSRLPGGRQYTLPNETLWVELLHAGNDQVRRYMYEKAVLKTDHQSRLAGERGMHCLPRKLIAHDCVLAVSRAAADLISGVEIAQRHWQLLCCEGGLDCPR